MDDCDKQDPDKVSFNERKEQERLEWLTACDERVYAFDSPHRHDPTNFPLT